MNKALVMANSIWHIKNNEIDVLKDAQWINDHLLYDCDMKINDISLHYYRQLTDIRYFIIKVLEAQNIEKNIAIFNDYLALSSYHHEIDMRDGQLVMNTVANNEIGDELLSMIAKDFAMLYIGGDMTKLKRCHNKECKYYFLDASKNMSKKYCSTRCSNLMKVRRHRQKKQSQ